jgi:hypothetical protein
MGREWTADALGSCEGAAYCATGEIALCVVQQLNLRNMCELSPLCDTVFVH